VRIKLANSLIKRLYKGAKHEKGAIYETDGDGRDGRRKGSDINNKPE
jgi:hypothetical protein